MLTVPRKVMDGSPLTRKVTYGCQMVIQGQGLFLKCGLRWTIPPVVRMGYDLDTQLQLSVSRRVQVVCHKMEIWPQHDLRPKSHLKDGQSVRVPLVNPGLAQVHHTDSYMRTLLRNDGACRSTNVPGPHTADFQHFRHAGL